MSSVAGDEAQVISVIVVRTPSWLHVASSTTRSASNPLAVNDGCLLKKDTLVFWIVDCRSEMFKVAIYAFATAALAMSQGRNESQFKTKPNVLWAAISTNDPIFYAGRTEGLSISFAVVNDGNSTINPKIEASHLLINGVEPKNWPFVISNGIRSSQFYALPQNHALQFVYSLGEYFKNPGIYTVTWKGENFRAPDITFRVLPLPKEWKR
jgi:hypothetical protein